MIRRPPRSTQSSYNNVMSPGEGERSLYGPHQYSPSRRAAPAASTDQFQPTFEPLTSMAQMAGGLTPDPAGFLSPLGSPAEPGPQPTFPTGPPVSVTHATTTSASYVESLNSDYHGDHPLPSFQDTYVSQGFIYPRAEETKIDFNQQREQEAPPELYYHGQYQTFQFTDSHNFLKPPSVDPGDPAFNKAPESESYPAPPFPPFPDHVDGMNSEYHPDHDDYNTDRYQGYHHGPAPEHSRLFDGQPGPALFRHDLQLGQSLRHGFGHRRALNAMDNSPMGPDVKFGAAAGCPPSLAHGGAHAHKQKETLLCAVCGDNAACQHYGVRTCEGCKGFFKRTVQKNSKYVCLGNKNCPVDKRTRNRCQFCRFQKCLVVGMVKEVVRTDGLKGRRGRLPSKPKSPLEAPPSPPVSLITALVRAHVDTSPDLPSLDYTQFDAQSLATDAVVMDTQTAHLLSAMEASVTCTRQWSDKLPGLSELRREDQALLRQSALLELFCLRLAYRTQLEDERVVFCNGQVLHLSQLGCFRHWIGAIREYGLALHRMGLDISALACMEALTLITQRPGLVNSKQVEDLQMRLTDTLRDHCTYNSEAQKKPQYFSKILGKIPELRTLSREGANLLQELKQNSGCTLPPLIDNFFMD